MMVGLGDFVSALKGLATFLLATALPALLAVAATRIQWRDVKVKEVAEGTRATDILYAHLNTLVDQLQAERDYAARSSRAMMADLEKLRGIRFGLEAKLMEMRDACLAARVMVHELQRRLGMPETPFDPLPFPGLAPGWPSPA